MAGFLDQFRKKVFYSVRKEEPDTEVSVKVDDKIALGVLLWVVAQADKQFLPEEEDKIKEVLKDRGHVSDEDMPYVLAAVQKAEEERIDLFAFTHEISQDLPFDMKKGILENLFRVACIDNDLAHEEEDIIRKISGLFRLDHKDFIDAKIRIKKEFGLDTAGL
ncbi:MAG: TerB family tellurite resistance protein [Candidatus Omnitrophica bacterium]|nr:TerB family tellurite resistance protein [Candidatus Omnitrophota bacterium]